MNEPGQAAVKSYKDILPRDDPDDRAYQNIVQRIAPYTMTLREGLDATYCLFQAVKYITRNGIAGAITECGVWRGGSMMLMALALKHFGDTARTLYLYDTFDGMTRPTDRDVDFDGNAMKTVWTQAAREGKAIGYGGPVDTVKFNLQSTGYPMDQVHFVAGDVLQTIPAQMPPGIALLRLDTDWYESTLHELRHLYDRIVPNGVLIIDDYGWCQGARQATDEFFRERAFVPMMHRVDQGVRILIKA
jgi:hypothetical protein